MDMTSPVRTNQPVSDPPLRLTQVNHAPASYADEGQGPILLLIHGLPGSIRDWRYLVPQLAGVRTIRVDLPGFGATSRRDKSHWSVDQRAMWLIDFLDAIGVDEVVVAGHSMGAAIAIAMAAISPERVRRLALISSPGLYPHEMFVRGKMPGVSSMLRWRLFRWAVGPALRRGLIGAGFSSHLTIAEALAAVADAGLLDFQVHRQRVEALQHPTVVAWSQDDQWIDESLSQQLADACPAGPRLSWPTGGHNPQKHQATPLGASLSRWTLDAEDSAQSAGTAQNCS